MWPLLKAGGGTGTDRDVAVVANISARVGSIGDNRLGGWHSYRSSKAALNQRMVSSFSGFHESPYVCLDKWPIWSMKNCLDILCTLGHLGVMSCS